MLDAEPRAGGGKVLGIRLRNDDATLVRRTQAGDEQAFAAIFERHHAPLLAYCRHMLGNRDDGEDALQQAFIKVHRALLGGTTPRDLRPWLYAIARNCCLSAIAARRPTTALEEHTPALAGLSDEVRQREDLRELLDGIGRLPEDQRSALLLAELDDLSHQAIATVVGCPVSKVKALVYQARSALVADRDARERPCEEIREQLAVARGGELRRGSLRRHLNLCSGCRDFQLAVGAQRQSLAALLPVAPSAGLMAAILGHGSVHAAGIGGAGAGAGASPVGGAVGTSAGVTSAGTTVTGASGIATSGTAAAGTAVGAGAGTAAGTSVGALVGGGLVTKLAVGGAVAALAAAGTVAARQRLATAGSSGVARARFVAFAAHGGRVAGNGGGTNGPYDVSAPIVGSGDGLSVAPAGESPTALTGASGQGAPTSVDPFTAPTSGEGAQGLPALTGASPSNIALTTVSRQVKIGQGGASEGSSVQARRGRAKLRREALRRRALRLREAHRRASRLREARRRARLRKERLEALRRRHRAAAKPVKPSKPATSPVAPVPVHIRHRHAPSSATPSSTSETGTVGESKKTTEGQHHPPPTGTGAVGTKTTGASPETSTTGTRKGRASSGTGREKAGSSTGAGKSDAGTEKAGSSSGKGTAGSGAGGEKSSSTAGDKEAGKETGPGTRAGKGGSESSTSSGAQAGEKSGTPTHNSEASGAGTTDGKGSTPRAKKHLVEEGQLPNL
jgi:RNA polymerase sigma factor (sigma-70 family)